MESTVEKKKVRKPELLEQYYHESSRVWKVLKEKSQIKAKKEEV